MLHMFSEVPKKVNTFPFLVGKLVKPSFVLKKVFIFWSKIYKLPSGRHSDGLFTQRKYSAEKFMTACQSDPWSSPGSRTSRMRKAPQCCWVMGLQRRWARWPSLSSLWHPPFLAIAALSPHHKQDPSLNAYEQEEPL